VKNNILRYTLKKFSLVFFCFRSHNFSLTKMFTHDLSRETEAILRNAAHRRCNTFHIAW
jgi:hypothetical protein